MSGKFYKYFFCIVGAILLMGAGESGCNPQQEARQEAQNRASSRRAYIPHNDLEFKNYDKRQRIADDPTMILWCTSSFPIPSSPLFTVPVVGKLTSGGKRPFPDDPGPDGMYGHSGDYRYGFTPADIYSEWYGMPVFCSAQPSVWQRESTTIVMRDDPTLLDAHKKAREALKGGNAAEANRLLEEAVNKAGRKQ